MLARQTELGVKGWRTFVSCPSNQCTMPNVYVALPNYTNCGNISIVQVIMENEDDIAKIMTMESGKPLQEAKNEIVAGVSCLDWMAGEAVRCGVL